MFKVNDAWGIAAAMLSLIALYLVLRNPTGVQVGLKTFGGAVNDTIRNLQGRDA